MTPYTWEGVVQRYCEDGGCEPWIDSPADAVAHARELLWRPWDLRLLVAAAARVGNDEVFTRTMSCILVGLPAVPERGPAFRAVLTMGQDTVAFHPWTPESLAVREILFLGNVAWSRMRGEGIEAGLTVEAAPLRRRYQPLYWWARAARTWLGRMYTPCAPREDAWTELGGIRVEGELTEKWLGDYVEPLVKTETA